MRPVSQRRLVSCPSSWPAGTQPRFQLAVCPWQLLALLALTRVGVDSPSRHGRFAEPMLPDVCVLGSPTRKNDLISSGACYSFVLRSTNVLPGSDELVLDGCMDGTGLVGRELVLDRL